MPAAARGRYSQVQISDTGTFENRRKCNPNPNPNSDAKSNPFPNSNLTLTLKRTLKVKVKMHTLDIAPLRSESPLQKRSGMARRVLKGFHSFTCTPTRSSAIAMSHT